MTEAYIKCPALRVAPGKHPDVVCVETGLSATRRDFCPISQGTTAECTFTQDTLPFISLGFISKWQQIEEARDNQILSAEKPLVE